MEKYEKDHMCPVKQDFVVNFSERSFELFGQPYRTLEYFCHKCKEMFYSPEEIQRINSTKYHKNCGGLVQHLIHSQFNVSKPLPICIRAVVKNEHQARLRYEEFANRLGGTTEEISVITRAKITLKGGWPQFFVSGIVKPKEKK